MSIRVDVWSDLACPWCYVGKRRLEAAIARVGQPVDIHWHSFELDARAPRVAEAGRTQAERLAAKYGVPVAEAEERIRRLTELAAQDGLVLRFDIIRPGNTFDAHRLLHLAAAHGRPAELAERLFRAYFTEGEAIGDPEALARLAVEAGLPAADVHDVLATDRFAADVRTDEHQARELDITGVPFFVLALRFGVAGAQPVDVLASMLERAAAEPPTE